MTYINTSVNVISLFLRQDHIVNSYSSHGIQCPQGLFSQTCCFTSYSSFCICAFDFSLLSVSLCTCLYWISSYWFPFLQFAKPFWILISSFKVLTTPSILVPSSDFTSIQPILSRKTSLTAFHRIIFRTDQKPPNGRGLKGPLKII